MIRRSCKDFDALPEGACRDCVYRLTVHERRVLKMVAEGMTTGDIAEALFVSRKTVEAHRQNLGRKLGTYSVALQTKYAVKKGLTTLEG